MSCKITPKLPASDINQDVWDWLSVGSWFLYDGGLYFVCAVGQAENVCDPSTYIELEDCTKQIIPVDVEIKWTYKKNKKKQKKGEK